MAALVPAGAGAGVGTVSYPATGNPPDPDPVQIESYSWGLTQTRPSDFTTVARAGKVQFQDFHFVMTPKPGLARLAYLGASAQLLENVRVDVDPDGAAGVGVTYCLSGVKVRKLSVSNIGSSGQDGVNVDLVYRKISVQTTLAVGGLAVATFDLTRGDIKKFRFGNTTSCPNTT